MNEAYQFIHHHHNMTRCTWHTLKPIVYTHARTWPQWTITSNKYWQICQTLSQKNKWLYPIGDSQGSLPQISTRHEEQQEVPNNHFAQAGVAYGNARQNGIMAKHVGEYFSIGTWGRHGQEP